MLLVVLIVVALVVLAVGAAWKRKNYWRDRGIPGPESSLFIGNLGLLGNTVDTPHPLAYVELTKKFGPFFGLQRGWRNLLVVSDPVLANEVLQVQFENFHGRDHVPLAGDEDTEPIANVFVSRGKRWKRLRALTASAFTTQNLKRVFPTVSACADQLIANIMEDIGQKGNKLDVQVNYHEYALDVLLRLAFGRSDSRAQIQGFVPNVQRLVEIPRCRAQTFSWIVPFASTLLKYMQHLQIIANNWGMVRFIRELINEIARRRSEKKNNTEKEEKGFTDLIDLFMEAESSDIQLEDNRNFDKRSIQVTKGLTSQELFAQCFLLMFAGFDTTAGALSFVAYYLATHPRVQEKLREEVVEICGGQEPSYDQLADLKYLDAILKETLRLQPIGAVVTSRKCAKSTKIGNLPVEAGTDVAVDVFSIHRSVDLWGADAGEFRPERWLQEDSAQLAANFYGFGGGPRACVGIRLAIIEEKLALIKLLQNFRLVEVEETKVDGRFENKCLEFFQKKNTQN